MDGNDDGPDGGFRFRMGWGPGLVVMAAIILFVIVLMATD